MRPYLKFAAVLALLAACGEGPLEPGRFTLEGSWQGRGFPYELVMDLDQDGGNRVTGTGEVRSIREVLETDTLSLDPFTTDTILIDTVVVNRVEVEVSGDWDYPDFTLTLRAEEFADVQYDGRFGSVSSDSVAGSLQGSGFANTNIPIVRQAGPE